MRNYPFSVLFIVDANSIAHHFSDEVWYRFARRAGEAGIDWIRMLSCWQRPIKTSRASILPFHRNDDNLADWNLPNLEWDKNLTRLQGILNKYGVGIWLDLFAQQYDRQDYRWSPFKYNVNNFDSWRATSDHAMMFFKTWITRAKIALSGGKYMLGWGNELVHPDDYKGDTPAQDEWARAWAIPLGNYMKKAEIRMPVPLSAGHPDGTGKSIYNRLCKQADPIWPWSHVFWVRHGLALPEHFDLYPIGSVNKHWGISDDGIGLNPKFVVPEEKQGKTVNQTGRHSSHWSYRIELVRYAREKWGQRLRSVEVMPMELKWDMWHPDNLHQEESLDFFWKCAKEVYGVDIRRSYPAPPKPPAPPEPPTPPVPPPPPPVKKSWWQRLLDWLFGENAWWRMKW